MKKKSTQLVSSSTLAAISEHIEHVGFNPNQGELTLNGYAFPWAVRGFPKIRRTREGDYRIIVELRADDATIQPWADPDSFSGSAYTS